MARAISLEKLKLFHKRQGRPAWGVDYQPAIRATPQEAPRTSRPAILTWERLLRDIHVLSQPERFAALLAMYNPRLVDLQEQRVLWPDPQPHPLAGSPYAAGMKLLSLEGSIKVAQRLGCLEIHPIVTDKTSENPQKWLTIPFPFVGDLLLFLEDEQKSVYCVNWTIKKNAEGFRRKVGTLRRNDAQEEKMLLRESQRHEIEETYYADVGIRTQRITEDMFDSHVAANLHQLFNWHRRKLSISFMQQEDMISRLQQLLQEGLPPIDEFPQMMKKIRCERHDCLGVLYQAIWHRKLRVDLFRPILVDRPLRAEKKDVLDAYASWFRG